MNPLRLTIKWRSTHEYIRLDLNRIDGTRIIRTEEDWLDGSLLKVYRPRVDYKQERDGSVKLILHYMPRDHPEYADLGPVWGHSTITISASHDSATAEWQSAPNNNSYNGPAPCKLTQERIPSEAQRENIKRIKRAQAKFKEALLRRETLCVATGEGFQPALEAAHIQDVEDLGPNIPENGFLLRADMHKLFDDGFFSIDDNGNWKFHKQLPAAYREQFATTRLPDSTFERIKEFISKRRQRDPAHDA